MLFFLMEFHFYAHVVYSTLTWVDFDASLGIKVVNKLLSVYL